jgi:hypothetical protein
MSRHTTLSEHRVESIYARHDCRAADFFNAAILWESLKNAAFNLEPFLLALAEGGSLSKEAKLQVCFARSRSQSGTISSCTWEGGLGPDVSPSQP